MISAFKYNPRLLVTFVLAAPLLAIIGAGALEELPRSPEMLFPAYLMGSVFTLAAWIVYSLQFQLLELLTRSTPILGSNGALFIASPIFGLVAGYSIFILLICGSSSWVHGGWTNCMIVCAVRDWKVSLLPGALCGLLASFFVLGE